MTLDDWKRQLPRKGRIGILLPECKSMSCWGLFPVLDRVEVMEFRDVGEVTGAYLSEFYGPNGKVMSWTFLPCSAQDRLDHDEDMLARHFGVARDQIEVLVE